MNSGATAERVYDALKRQIMIRTFRPGQRLDPAALAESLSSSVTPVRDALHVLAGERLVTARTGEGFHVPTLDEPALDDLYAWTAEALLIAIRAWPESGTAIAPEVLARTIDMAERAAALFAHIARHSANAEHQSTISSLNSRLHAVRTVEPTVIDQVEAEIDEIEAALTAKDARALRPLIVAYHRRRRRQAAAIVRAAYRAG